jgi:hypothetical protein
MFALPVTSSGKFYMSDKDGAVSRNELVLATQRRCVFQSEIRDETSGGWLATPQRLLPLVRTLFTAIAGNPHGYWLSGRLRWAIFSKVGRLSAKWYDFQGPEPSPLGPQPPESGTIFRGRLARTLKVVRFSADLKRRNDRAGRGQKERPLGHPQSESRRHKRPKVVRFSGSLGQPATMATASAGVAVNVALPRQILKSERAPASFNSRAASFSRRENSLSSGTSCASP